MELSSLRLLSFLCLLSTIPPQSSAGDGPLYPTAALPTKSGYLPINSSSGGELFYAFYEAQQPLPPPSSTPLLLWLQGGPGCSSMIANLFELGPFLLSSSNLLLHPNPFSWNRRFSLLFIDSPLGTGFSPSPSPSSIPRSLHSVASHLFSALQSFFSLNPSLRSRPFFITGESYAGKYIPAIARLILRRNPLLPTTLRINLAGVAIGNGLTHPVSQVRSHAATAYFAGLINDRQRGHLEELQDEAAALALAGDWIAAADARNRVLHWLQNATGLATLYDLTKSRPYATGSLGLFLNREEVKAALGAREGVWWKECGEEVGAALHGDVMRSAKFMVEEVVRGGRILLYQGIYDLRDGVASTEAWLREMEWEGIGRFLAAERVVWRVDGDLAGYVQRWGNLTHVVVSGAGHLVPADRGKNAQAMIEGWVLRTGAFEEDEAAAPPFRSQDKDDGGEDGGDHGGWRCRCCCGLLGMRCRCCRRTCEEVARKQ